MNNIITGFIEYFNIYKIHNFTKIELHIIDRKHILHVLSEHLTSLNYINNLLYVLDVESIKSIEDSLLRLKINDEYNIIEIGNISKDRWIKCNE